jgi:outer membrane biosynthesis protein TonB
MTLAVAILLFGISSAAVPVQAISVHAGNPQEQTTPQPASPSSDAQTNNSQTNNAPVEQDQSGATPPQSSSQTAKPAPSQSASQQKATPHKSSAKKRTRKKKVVASGCDTTPSSAASDSGSSPSGQSQQTAQANTPDSTPNPAAPKKCPPSITVVRQGGAKEPSIQLAGGPGGDAASQKRNAANQMLGSAEANLKQISAIQLNPAQQDTVTQIRQFVDQSKAALASGDLERGQTLAWKAKLLSDDLLKPQK